MFLLVWRGFVIILNFLLGSNRKLLIRPHIFLLPIYIHISRLSYINTAWVVLWAFSGPFELIGFAAMTSPSMSPAVLAKAALPRSEARAAAQIDARTCDILRRVEESSQNAEDAWEAVDTIQHIMKG